VVVDPTPASSTERSQVDATAVSTPLESPSSTVQADATEIAGTSPAPQTKADINGAKQAPSTAVTKTPRASTASTNANRDSSTSSAAQALANDSAASKSKAQSELETSQRLAQTNVSPTVSPKDGAQALASGMEQCGKEGFLSRFVCEQKMYMQYCEDKWDKDPRCMRRTANN
jgi:hypothetical protein